MSRLLITICLALLAPFILGGGLTPAHADGGGNCAKGNCEVWDNDPPRGGGKGGGNRGAVGYPKCSALPGAVAMLPGNTPDDEMDSWKQVRCRDDAGRLVTVWVQPGLSPIVSPAVMAQSLLAQMQLRGIRIGMVPENCSGCRGAVGMPIWLWVDQPGRTTWGPASISAGGVSLTARVNQVKWAFGNGDSVSCGLGTAYRDSYGVSKSPSCGYSYPKQGKYTVTATSYWTAEWNGYGQSGTINFTLDSSRTNVTIGEIQVLVTNGKRR